MLIIAREIQFRGYSDERAIPLSQSEGMVMRYLQAFQDVNVEVHVIQMAPLALINFLERWSKRHGG